MDNKAYQEQYKKTHRLNRIVTVLIEEQYITQAYLSLSDGALIKDWFTREDNIINRHHATRDESRLGGSKKFVSAKIENIDENEFVCFNSKVEVVFRCVPEGTDEFVGVFADILAANRFINSRDVPGEYYTTEHELVQ